MPENVNINVTYSRVDVNDGAIFIEVDMENTDCSVTLSVASKDASQLKDILLATPDVVHAILGEYIIKEMGITQNQLDEAVERVSTGLSTGHAEVERLAELVKPNEN